MPVPTKTFTYQEAGLAYTVTVYPSDDGRFYADITVDEGAMDVNAVYYGDDDFSGDSVSLDGPLNMNGTSLNGEPVQWDAAAELSDPGLGPEGTDKETYLSEGDTLTISLNNLESLDDLDVFGIRATSTTTDAGSIKGVSHEPEDPEEPEDFTFEKVFFVEQFDANGFPVGGFAISDEAPEPNTFNVPVLPEGTDPTFENYINFYDTNGGNYDDLDAVIFYNQDEDGNLDEIFRLEGTFADGDELLAAYEDAVEAGAFADLEAMPEGESGADLIAALAIAPETELDSGTTAMDDDMLEMA